MPYNQSQHRALPQSVNSALITITTALLILLTITPTQAQPSQENNSPTPPHRLLPEGTFVVARKATILPVGSTGAWVVDFVNEPGETKIPPCYLMPSRRLARLEKSLTRRQDKKSFSLILSGRLFVYQNYQFLLLTSTPRLIAAPEQAKPTETQTPPTNRNQNKPENTTTKKRETKTTPPSASADVEKMIHDLETGGPAAPIIRTSEPPAAQPSNNTANNQQSPTENPETEPLREGKFIDNRLVRMVRSPVNGAWSIAFNSDATGLADPPLILLPCRLLEQMEKRTKQLGDSYQLKISGTVYTYHNTKYLLPTTMIIPYPQDNLSP